MGAGAAWAAPGGVFARAWAAWAAACGHAPATVFLALVQAAGSFLALFLAGRAFLGAAANLTVNEAINRHRYRYLWDDASGKYENPFDRGFVANFREFFAAPPEVDAPPPPRGMHAGAAGGPGPFARMYVCFSASGFFELQEKVFDLVSNSPFAGMIAGLLFRFCPRQCGDVARELEYAAGVEEGVYG
mmetsp:Transcript_47461/g.152049  ORF Transcript_47461/g.152049 Transcript_47461/m.152049 type:complete len:188 (-) Transcript_47461:60-623(-)